MWCDCECALLLLKEADLCELRLNKHLRFVFDDTCTLLLAYINRWVLILALLLLLNFHFIHLPHENRIAQVLVVLSQQRHVHLLLSRRQPHVMALPDYWKRLLDNSWPLIALWHDLLRVSCALNQAPV